MQWVIDEYVDHLKANDSFFVKICVALFSEMSSKIFHIKSIQKSSAHQVSPQTSNSSRTGLPEYSVRDIFFSSLSSATRRIKTHGGHK